MRALEGPIDDAASPEQAGADPHPGAGGGAGAMPAVGSLPAADLLRAVAAHDVDPYTAADRLLELLLG